VRVENVLVSLIWSSPVQGASWSFESRAYAFNRTLRIFGYNAPTQYMEAVETPAGSGDFIWTRRTFASYAYTPVGNVLELDSKYEGIEAGTRLLISQPGISNALVTVTAVSQGQATFLAPSATTSPVQDTVTRLTLDFAPSSISDRRSTVIYEITSPRIRFWGYRYPEKLSGPTVYTPARRIYPETAEISRTIENNAFTPGVQLPLNTIEAGRQVILRDSAGEPMSAEVTSVAAIGLDVDVTTTPDDLTTALELRLNREEAQQL